VPGRRRRTYSAGEAARRRHAWLELIQTSGLFLTLPVVDRAWPDGLPEVAAGPRAASRAAVAEAIRTNGATRHQAVRTVLCEALDWAEHLRLDTDLPASLAEPVPEHGLTVAPDLGFWAEPDDEDADSGMWRLLGLVTAWGSHPLARTTENGWTASAVERLAVLLRARDVPVGVVTDGRWWAVVWAPKGGTTGAAVWDASLWGEEPESFRAFVALLTRSRFLAVAAGETLPALLLESLGAQEEVTETLGRQVRDAVELLLETLDRLDAETGVLDGVTDDDLYDGVVTVLMRLVFLLFAEERRLLPSDDATYVAAYSVSRLVEQLESAEALAGPQSLEHRTGAWHRLLAVSRALHRGVAHEDLRMPAYGGTLFDPDRFPWLEGRRDPDDVQARPPAVDDRTVLRLLRAVQYVEVGGERRRLTFRALDVEQIGYVYEGLLELEVRTAPEVILGLVRPPSWPKGKAPAEITLTDAVERLGQPSGPTMAEWVAARTGWSATRLAKVFQTPLQVERRAALVRAVGDVELATSIEPYAAVLRWDELGRPSVTLPGRRYVAPSTRRASTGTHYTPRSLAEDVAGHALEALVFRPGPLETADRTTWRIRPSSELLDLRVADIAMGSGAFLVAACRYLADRLVEAWEVEGRPEALLAARHRTVQRLSADAEVEQVALEARRLVAEHCLYGVDVNPLAVEMAKLSLWLVTMDRERPFGFLDDRLVAGDSLLGLASVRQLMTLHAHPDGGEHSLDTALSEDALKLAADIRRQITAQAVVTKRDVDHKNMLLKQAQALTRDLETVADAVTGVGLVSASLPAKRANDAFRALSWKVSTASQDLTVDLAAELALVQAGRPVMATPRVPLHWPLAFPEVFADTATPGFDAIIGNPPFLGGKKISGALGDDYLAWLARWDGRGVKGNADLAARFVLRAERLLSKRGQLGYIATNTLVQGDTLEVGLAEAARRGLVVRRGAPSHPWPSASANLEIVDVWASRAPIAPDGLRVLAGEEVPAIGADLEPVGRVTGRPQRLPENDGVAFIGSYVLGLGFTMTHDQAEALVARDARNADVLQPYVIGQDLNSRPDCSASRWIINFRDRSLKRAEEYPDALEIVGRLVKPQRDLLPDYKARVRDHWWRYEHQGPALYRAIADLDYVLALSLVSNVVMPVRVPSGPVFAHKCAVFALDDYASLAVLSSSAHTSWVVRYSSTMRTDVNYSPSDVFLTLPRPLSTPELRRLGERLDTERRALMLGRSWGLTTTYNHVHDAADRDPAVVALRELHAEIDAAVLDAYGWDLDLEIGHHLTKIGTRWTVSRRARFELLDLLLEENHRRAGVLS